MTADEVRQAVREIALQGMISGHLEALRRFTATASDPQAFATEQADKIEKAFNELVRLYAREAF